MLYAEAQLQVKRRRRKKVPVIYRQPLVRPERCNDVLSADFVFDRTVERRVLKCLTIVDDASTEAVAVEAARAIGGLPVVPSASRNLDRPVSSDEGGLILHEPVVHSEQNVRHGRRRHYDRHGRRFSARASRQSWRARTQ